MAPDRPEGDQGGERDTELAAIWERWTAGGEAIIRGNNGIAKGTGWVGGLR